MMITLDLLLCHSINSCIISSLQFKFTASSCVAIEEFFEVHCALRFVISSDRCWTVLIRLGTCIGPSTNALQYYFSLLFYYMTFSSEGQSLEPDLCKVLTQLSHSIIAWFSPYYTTHWKMFLKLNFQYKSAKQSVGPCLKYHIRKLTIFKVIHYFVGVSGHVTILVKRLLTRHFCKNKNGNAAWRRHYMLHVLRPSISSIAVKGNARTKT